MFYVVRQCFLRVRCQVHREKIKSEILWIPNHHSRTVGVKRIENTAFRRTIKCLEYTMSYYLSSLSYAFCSENKNWNIINMKNTTCPGCLCLSGTQLCPLEHCLILKWYSHKNLYRTTNDTLKPCCLYSQYGKSTCKPQF